MLNRKKKCLCDIRKGVVRFKCQAHHNAIENGTAYFCLIYNIFRCCLFLAAKHSVICQFAVFFLNPIYILLTNVFHQMDNWRNVSATQRISFLNDLNFSVIYNAIAYSNWIEQKGHLSNWMDWFKSLEMYSRIENRLYAYNRKKIIYHKSINESFFNQTIDKDPTCQGMSRIHVNDRQWFFH